MCNSYKRINNEFLRRLFFRSFPLICVGLVISSIGLVILIGELYSCGRTLSCSSGSTDEIYCDKYGNCYCNQAKTIPAIMIHCSYFTSLSYSCIALFICIIVLFVCVYFGEQDPEIAILSMDPLPMSLIKPT